MFLSIDVGNTQTAIGLFDSEGTMMRGWRMPTDQSDTSDILHGRLFTFFQKDGLSLDDVEAGGLSCVVPVITRAWQRCFELLLNKPLTRINALSTDKIRFNIPHPELVGADRVANSVAATERYGYPVIVVDFGTATNLDVVDKDGVFRGGAISPGIMISANALFSRAAKLSSIPIKAPETVLGNTTESAVQAGIVVGAAAQAEGLVARTLKEPGIEGATVIATGGLANTVSEATDVFDVVDPQLTMRGIYLIWKQSTQAAE